MQLIFIVLLGAVLGFVYGSYTDGFIFSSKICLFAGLTLIMPSLFKFKLLDIKLVWIHKNILLKGLLVNFIALPLIAVAIGLMTGDFGVASGLFLISVLSGGGMVMHWIKKSGGDTSFGFLLLFINLIFISLSLLMLHFFAIYSAGYFESRYDSEVHLSRFASVVIELLIVIPFLASRVILFIKPLVDIIEKYKKVISHLSIFVILFYLFGLQSSQRLVDVYDFDLYLFWVAPLAVIVYYLLITLLARWVYDLNSPQERAAFWQTVTRYLTLALVLSTFSASTFGISMLLPIMFAYLVQIPMAIYLERTMPKLTS